MSSSGKKSEYEICMEFVEGHRYLFSNGIALVEIKKNNTKNIVPVNSQEFREWIRYHLYTEYGKTIGPDSLNNIIDTMCAKTRYSAQKVNTNIRVGLDKNTYYYDLGNEKGNYVQITSKGFDIVDNAPIYFMNSDASLGQCLPICNIDITIMQLKKYINIKSMSDFYLLVVHIISCFIPEIPHHILILLGNQGSAKSTTSRIIKKLVDPSKIDISAIPKNKEDLVLQLSSEYMVVYDNMNVIKSEYNDIFCQVATGGNFVKRTLYTDNKLSVFSFKRCLILNGINYVTNQADLLDRSIVVTLKTLADEERRTETDIFYEFNKDIPYFLYSIFETIVQAKKIYKEIKLEKLPRMADAVKWGCAIAEALGIGKEKYFEIYNANQNKINMEILSDNPLAFALMHLMKKQKTWKGAVNELWNKLNYIATSKNIDRSGNMWPKSPSHLSRNLNQLKISLERIGICFEINNTGRYKEINLKYRAEE